MSRETSILVVSTLVLFFVRVGGVYGGTSPMNVVKKANERIEKLMDKKVVKGSAEERKRDEKIKKIIDELLDFDALSRKALGKHWKERTEEEKKEFVELFRKLLQKNYLKQVHEKSNYEVIYDGEEVEGNKAVVNTTIKAKNKEGEEAETSLVYKLHRKGSRWLVYDIETDEVSLIQNYRSQFARIINKDGYLTLINKMKKKIEQQSEAEDT